MGETSIPCAREYHPVTSRPYIEESIITGNANVIELQIDAGNENRGKVEFCLATDIIFL